MISMMTRCPCFLEVAQTLTVPYPPCPKLLLVQVPFPTCDFLTVRFVTALPCVECMTKACTVCSQPQALVVAGKKLPWRDFNLLLAGMASESESYWYHWQVGSILAFHSHLQATDVHGSEC